MTRLRVLAVLLALAGAAHAFTDPPYWFRNYQKAFKFARERRQPIAVVFGLSTTKATHELMVRLKEDPELEHALDGFARVELEEPDQGIAASVYGIWVVPTLVILDRYEREVGRLSFPQADEQWRQELLAMCARAQDPSGNVATHATDDGAGAPPPPPSAPQTGAVENGPMTFREQDFAAPMAASGAPAAAPRKEPTANEIVSLGQRLITSRPPAPRGRPASADPRQFEAAARIQAITAGLNVHGGTAQP